jgi:NADH-quinone oxidoreductase subunit G
METVTLTIDGRSITVEKGRSVLQAALDHGIHVPFYCYHPGISVDGSCRVCLVKVEKMPKLQTACSTLCAEGMVVQTRAPEVVEAQASVFEFLLINHPLDCPVCDKGGECPLQDYSYSFGPKGSRMEFPRRTFDGEGVRADVDFGPTLMLNRNRCILCTRCVRFMRDVDGDAQINIVDRGNGSEIATFQEEGVHSLLSGNLVDICPVGAITTRAYRFKSRPWDNPLAVDTICTQCSKGCNTTVWMRGKQEWAKAPRLVRVTPRLNPAVNGYWMCDIGRFEWGWVEGDDRLRQPLVRNAAGELSPSTWQDAMTALAGHFATAGGSRHILASAHASLEELFVIKSIASSLRSGTNVHVGWRVREKSQPPNARFKVPAIDAPNVRGARDLGLVSGPGQEADLSALREAVRQGRVATLYVFDPGPDGSIGDLSWIVDARHQGRIPLLVVQGVQTSPLVAEADFVLPGASWAEKDASYTNGEGQVQVTSRALAPPGEAMEDWRILANVAVALGLPLSWTSAEAVRADLVAALADRPAYAGLGDVAFAKPVPARTWLQASNPSERWKWDFMFRDLPPVKFTDEPGAAQALLDAIPLKKVE